MFRHTSNELGALGEGVAAAFLKRRGVHIVGRNIFVDRDEIDIIYRGDTGLVAVEVKTVSEGTDPFDALTDEKLRRIRRAVSGFGRPIVAIDAIGIALRDDGVKVCWLRGIG
jgi:Holliday junction resolvase-like predicted endonuclease